MQPGPIHAGRLVFLGVAMIRSYQACLRPLMIGTCKFCPSCSDYAIEALQRHGLRSGVGLAVRRLIRCHPFSPGGIDPVPACNHRNR
ncbi:MAG: membrane protein insertion efficiency factor YidD [bacterium]|nr:membrane protein insertion efficiency factor YidD [bacterium]